MAARQRKALDFPAWPQFDDAERTGLLRALEQGQWWRMGGSETTSFEREFAEYHGADHALAVTNGTHALQLALEILGVRPGDEVLVPAFTFISSSLAVQNIGAIPVPVDVRPDTYCIDVEAAAAAITPRTRVIMPVHMAGQVADMDALSKVAADAGVEVLQDAAHAHGARWRGQRLGELGSVAAFSFQNGKLMTAGEGGALLLPNQDLLEAAFLRHNCGRPRSDLRYLHRTSGSNLRMNEFSAAVLRAQLGRLEGQLRVREERSVLLSRLLARLPGVEPQARDERCDLNSHYMAMFRLTGWSEEQRNRFVAELVARGIPAFVAFRAIYRTDGFWDSVTPGTTVDELAERCPNSEQITRDCVWLHHRVLLASEQVIHDLVDEIADVLAHA